MQRKILLLVIASIMVMLVSIGLVSYLTVHESINHSLDNHLTLAALLGKGMDYTLERNITRLHDISFSGSIDFNDGDWTPEKHALHTAYEYSIFSDGVFLMDLDGNILERYPHRDSGAINLLGISYVQEALRSRQTVVSDIYTLTPTRRQVIFILVPLKDRMGNMVGLVGGEINPSNYFFTWVIRALPTNDRMTVELIDSHGIIISSSNPERTLTYTDHDRFLGNLIKSKTARVSKCHRCHTRGSDSREADMMAFAPLSFAPWGITVRQPESLVFEPATYMKKAFVLITFIVIFVAVILSIGLSRSIVLPLSALGSASERIASGELSTPVPFYGGDEIGDLAESFESMRQRLADSLERGRLHTVELEDRVRERTDALRNQKRQLALLLDEGIRAQEDERKRIARELHDETSQTLAALGMSLEIASVALTTGKLKPDMILELRGKVSILMDGINRLIHDLRPPVFDDLGLESAIRWLLERHLGENDIAYNIETSGLDALLLDSKTELSLFRIVQESAINIAKHSKAESVDISFSYVEGHLGFEITDDGVGFDLKEVLKAHELGSEHGFGLMGMNERVANLGGELMIRSREGHGTKITILITEKKEDSDA